VRASRELPDTDVSILIVDAVEGIFEMDKLVAKKIGEAGKAVIIAVNKWDLLDDSDAMRHEYLKYVRSHFVKLSWADIVFVSALKGHGLSELLEAVLNALAMYHKRVPQKVLREVLFEEITLHPPPVMKNNPLKFYDMRQVSTCPPTFKLWINLKKGLHFSYRGFIENTIRGHFGFRGTFINVIYEEKKRRDRSSMR
jgi:GTP-binding protein